MNRRRDGLHRIRPSKIGPTMSTRSRHVNPKAPAAERLMRHALEPAAIDRDELTVAAPPGWLTEEMTNAPKVSFPFFAHVAKRNHRPPKFNSTVFCRAKRP